MAVPTRIPSTFRRTPLVKALDPVKFSMSRTAIEQVGPGGQDILSPGSIGQLALRIQGLLNVAARRLGLDPRTVSIQAVLDEITILSASLRPGERTSIIDRNKVESAQIAISEAEGVKASLLSVVESQASTDTLRTRERVQSQVSNSSLREELLARINEISRNSRFG